jgi:hypothetical protein
MKWFLLGVLLTHVFSHLSGYLDEVEEIFQTEREAQLGIARLLAQSRKN